MDLISRDATSFTTLRFNSSSFSEIEEVLTTNGDVWEVDEWFRRFVEDISLPDWEFAASSRQG